MGQRLSFPCRFFFSVDTGSLQICAGALQRSGARENFHTALQKKQFHWIETAALVKFHFRSQSKMR